jgi:hypothetical protein
VDEVAGMLSTLSIHGRHDIITPSPPTGWRRALADCHCGSATCDGLLCLERLRALPSEEATAYIATLGGLGKKSCACISLLCLGHKVSPTFIPISFNTHTHIHTHTLLRDCPLSRISFAVARIH